MKKVLIILASIAFVSAQAKTENFDQPITFHGQKFDCQALDHVTIFAKKNNLDIKKVRQAFNLVDQTGKSDHDISTATGLTDSEVKIIRHNAHDVILHCTPHIAKNN